ncbi:phosphate ABC transporter membrane protein 2, PhoT family [Abditibacterium utsteinense]|uniref:Phosphate transport system permease protein PstA n=1 Tax=Abditibacterium utsteinense TaxID=1960156 RepID=A0A2S8SRN4_9BACT|nr:phosphate ABC transporter permease PstA [Abditibacterium utsteinense]PQV63436.1 phosphate ABC transporter membrane protein 2, PhoT family [Abditibacterium utsteinense]
MQSTYSPQTSAATRPLPPMSKSLMNWRSFKSQAMRFLCALATFIAVIPLVLVLFTIAAKGLPVMNLEFFTATEHAAGDPGGGLKHAILGTLMMVGIASCLGLPIGVLGGLYLSEFGNNRLGFAFRFAADVLNGIPSIVVGVFVYTIAVLPVTKATDGDITFSALAGGLALGIMMVPTVMRTTEEIVRLVPMSLREGALALGDTRWHSVFKIVLGAAKGGVITGVLLSVARISGETAPLLFTALGSRYVNFDVRHATASLPVKIYDFATSADDHWNALAWGGALVLVTLILVLSIAARYFTRAKNA